jgi:hypothetical protein
VKRETALGLYKGLGAVMTGIVPKMATRFTSYEWYKQMLADKEGNVNAKSTFTGTSISLVSSNKALSKASLRTIDAVEAQIS